MSYQEGLSPPLDPDFLVKLIKASIRSDLPPAGFSPLEASEADLLKLGFPRRPDPALRPAEYAFWQELFSPPLVFEAFDIGILPVVTTQSRARFAQLPRRQTSFNWSGAYITPRDATIFSSIWGKWQVPTPELPPDGVAGRKYSSSTWIGFDGQRRYYRSTLPQIGTAQTIEPTMAAPKTYMAWWQWWVRDVAGQAHPIALPAPAIHAGDLIMCSMTVQDDRSNVAFVIRNVTTNRTVQFTQMAPPDNWNQPFKVSGATAEWVMERPAEPPDPTPLELPDYGTVNFRDCGATAIHFKTKAPVQRSLSAARLIDMDVVKHNPDRTAKISIAVPIDETEFLTHFR